MPYDSGAAAQAFNEAKEALLAKARAVSAVAGWEALAIANEAEAALRAAERCQYLPLFGAMGNWGGRGPMLTNAVIQHMEDPEVARAAFLQAVVFKDRVDHLIISALELECQCEERP